MSLNNEIENLLREKAAALIAQDTEKLGSLIDPSFVYVNSHGKKSDKKQYVDQFFWGLLKFKSQRFENIQATDFGDFAVATMTVHDEFEYSGTPYNGVFQSMCVFKKVESNWYWAAGQTFEVKKNE